MQMTPPTRPAQKVYPGLSLNQRKYLHLCVRSGANWFFWIAALSLVNTLLVALGFDLAFFLGLAFTQIVDAVSSEWEGLSRLIFIGIDYLCLGVFAGLGLLAHRKQAWAFLTGIILYSLDALLLFAVLMGSGRLPFISLAIHGYAIYRMVGGFNAVRVLAQHEVAPSPPGPEVMFAPEQPT
jgi:hypothetical protein